jgi:Icc protein
VTFASPDTRARASEEVVACGQNDEIVSLGSTIRLAHLSDTHLAGEAEILPFGRDSAATLSAVIEAYAARPDVAVITGDLAEDPSREAYRKVRALASPLADELHVVAGNHDDRVTIDEVLGAGDDLRVVPLSPHWTMVLVNSQWAGHDAGRIESETLAALDEALARTRQHVVVCMHHPPASTCANPYCRIVNAGEVLDVLSRSSRPRAVLSGHLHRSFDNTHGGIRFLGAPSTCRQLTHGGNPHFGLTSAPPAARLIELHADGGITYETVSAHYAYADR